MFFELVQNMKQVVDFNCYRRGGRAVECTGLENRQGLTALVSSNLTLSASCWENSCRTGSVVRDGHEAKITPEGRPRRGEAPPAVGKILVGLDQLSVTATKF